MVYFLLVHEAGADWPHERFTAAPAQGEHDKHMTARLTGPDSLEPRLCPGMSRIGKYSEGTRKNRLNFGNGDAVPLAFGAIARVPIEARQRSVHIDHNMILYIQMSIIDQAANLNLDEEMAAFFVRHGVKAARPMRRAIDFVVIREYPSINEDSGLR